MSNPKPCHPARAASRSTLLSLSGSLPVVVHQDPRAESFAGVHLSKGEIPFTIFKEEDLKKASLCAVTRCSYHLETTPSAGVCRKFVTTCFVQAYCLYCCFSIGGHSGVYLV